MVNRTQARPGADRKQPPARDALAQKQSRDTHAWADQLRNRHMIFARLSEVTLKPASRLSNRDRYDGLLLVVFRLDLGSRRLCILCIHLKGIGEEPWSEAH